MLIRGVVGAGCLTLRIMIFDHKGGHYISLWLLLVAIAGSNRATDKCGFNIEALLLRLPMCHQFGSYDLVPFNSVPQPHFLWKKK